MFFSQGPVQGGDVHMKGRVLMLEAELGRKLAEIHALRSAYESLSSSATASSTTCARQAEELAEKQQQLDEANLRLAQQQESIEQMTAQLQQVTADLAAETEKCKHATAAAADAQEQLGYVQQALESSRDVVYSLQAACLELKTAQAEAKEAAAGMAAAAAQLKREKRDIERWLAATAAEADSARAAAEAAGRGEAAVLVVMATLAQQHADNKQALQQARGQLEACETTAADLARQLKRVTSNNKKLRLKAELAEAAWGAADDVADKTLYHLECSRAQVRLLQQQLARRKTSEETWRFYSENWQKMFEEQKERVNKLMGEKQVVTHLCFCKA
jgi:chromosome segregation ATPase